MKMIKRLFWYGKIINKIDSKRIPLTIVLFTLLPLSDLLFSVWLLKYIVQGFVNNDIKLSNFVVVMILLLFFQLITWCIESYYSEWFVANSDIRISNGIHKLIFNKVNSLKLEEIEEDTFFDKYYHLLSDCDNRIGSFVGYISSATSSFIMIITLAGIIAGTHPVLFIFVSFPVICEAIIAPSLKKKKYEYDLKKKEQLRRADYAKRVVYLRDYAKEIRTTNIWHVVWNQYEDFFKKTQQLIRKYGVKVAIRQGLIDYSYQVLSFFAIIVFISFAVYYEMIELSNGIIIITTYNQIVYSIKNMADLLAQGYEQSLYIRELQDFMDINISDDARNQMKIQQIETIEFKDVSFSYGESKQVLNNISFKIQRGQKVAILGMNGAGKSTLIKLIIGVYEPKTGEILVNGIDRKKINIEFYQKNVSAVFQNYKLFAMNIEKNVIEKNIKCTEDFDVFMEAVEKSGFMCKLNQLPKGSKTSISKEYDSEGVVLSGGEMQKIAIARAIAKKTDVLLFDEPTSALDPLAESRFYQMVENNFSDKIVLYVSHNYSEALFADKIIFLSDGKIAERGTHSKLIELNGQYCTLYKLQKANFFSSRREGSK